MTSLLSNNWCNNTVNISAHIHGVIDLQPSERKSSITEPLSAHNWSLLQLWLYSRFKTKTKNQHTFLKMAWQYLWPYCLIHVCSIIYVTYCVSSIFVVGCRGNAPIWQHTLDKTVSPSSRLTLPASPGPWFMIHDSHKKFLQTASTSSICHEYFSEGKRLFPYLQIFLIIAQTPSDIIYREH